MPNIEIKARYDDLNKARLIARELNARFAGLDHQADTYFKTKKGRLKLRESKLSGGQLVAYLRPNEAGPKKSEYELIPVKNVAATKELLTRMLGRDVVVAKKRSIYLLDNVRIHLDEVDGLGNFFEFEAVYSDSAQERRERTKVRDLIHRFGIRSSSLITGSYRELIKTRKKKAN